MENEVNQQSNVNFLNEFSNFIFTSKYARYNEKVDRRETWEECISRVEKMHLDKFKSKISSEDLNEIKWAFQKVKDKKVVPSMRSMQFGGKAVLAHNPRIFNCAVRHIDSIRAFSESFYLLLCGTGVGFGLSKHFINRLPNLVSKKDKTGTVVTYVVQDSIEGWADSIEALLNCYFKNTAYTGRKIIFDYSRIRPEGAALKTGGGKAPGYKGLKRAHIKVKEILDHIIEDLHQTKLHPINAYDILMHIADAVLSGGIRRSACSVIFDKDDEEMMNAKTFFNVSKHTKFTFDEETQKWYGKITVDNKKYEVDLYDYDYQQVINEKKISWFYIEPQRARSNNSVLFLRDEVSIDEFKGIIEKTRQFGEPGFVFGDHKWQLFNPCFEINFIPVTEDGVCGVQFCNLSSINGAKVDTKEDFFESIKAATIIGTLQASYTDFSYLSNAAKNLTDEEALLGVSITGMMDNPDVLLNAKNQKEGAKIAKEINEKWAKIIGINPAARITCIKPEGTSSAVLGSASGIHPHHSHRYFRRVQCNKIDPVYKFFKKHNKHMIEESVWSANKTDDVIAFPLTISDKAMVKSDLSAIQHLDYIKSTQMNWVNQGATENNHKKLNHNVSCTVLVKEDEWDQVISYLYENRKYFCAVALLPASGDKIYQQAPLESVTTEDDEIKWKNIVDNYLTVDYTLLHEGKDNTELSKEAACVGGTCEIGFVK